MAPTNGGKVEFGKNHEHLRSRAIQHKLCGQCGRPLDYWMFFIIDNFDPSRRDQLFEPAMHEDCARYAFAVCPFLGHPNYKANVESEYPRWEIDHATSTATFNPFPGGEKRPERMCLVKTRNYRIKRKPDGWLIMVASNLELVETF